MLNRKTIESFVDRCIKLQLHEVANNDLAVVLLEQYSDKKENDIFSLINSSQFWEVIDELSEQLKFINAAHEYEGMHDFYFSADIPGENGKKQNFDRKHHTEALKALEDLQTITSDRWHSMFPAIKSLLAPLLLYKVLNTPSQKALEFYVSRFDKDMLDNAKTYVAKNPICFIQGKRTLVSIDLIFKFFGEDEMFISQLLPTTTSKLDGKHFAYSVFSNCQLKHAQKCWQAATEDQKQALLSVISKPLGEILDAALVVAHVSKNTTMMNWLWDLADTPQKQEDVLGNLRAKSKSNSVVLFPKAYNSYIETINHLESKMPKANWKSLK